MTNLLSLILTFSKTNSKFTFYPRFILFRHPIIHHTILGLDVSAMKSVRISRGYTYRMIVLAHVAIFPHT